MFYTILFAVLLVAVPFAFVKLMSAIQCSRQKRLTADHYTQFKQIAMDNFLHPSDTIMIKNQLMGIDGFKRKLLLAHSNPVKQLVWEIIDLYSISECSVYITKGLNPQEDYSKTFHIKELGLRLHFFYDRPPLDVIFYQHSTDDQKKLLKAKTAAGKWEKIVRTHIKMTRSSFAFSG